MTAAELLPALEAAGVRLVLTGPGTMEAEIPDPTPPEVVRLLEEARRHRGEVLRSLEGRRRGKILAFPTRPPGTPYHLRLAKDYTVDAVRGGEPCGCGRADWRLTPVGLWLCDCGAYWRHRRTAAAAATRSETDENAVVPVEIETRRPV